jgi:hypothetical protein
MKVKSVHHVEGRGMLVAIDEPIRGIAPGWHVGCGENVWAVAAVDQSRGMRGRAVVGLQLVPVKGDAQPKAGDVLEARARS